MNLHPRLKYFCDLGCKRVLYLILNLEENEADDNDHDKGDILSHGISNFYLGCPLASMERWQLRRFC